jgi:ActR/RegA family two-component response regulator
MSFERVIAALDSKQQTILRAVKNHAESLLDHSPRFKFFTLHGKTHIENLFVILQILIDGGIKLKPEERYLLSLAICVHDLGMVVSLRDYDVTKVLDGRPAATDPAALELFVRETHHELVDEYFRKNLDFLIALGVSPTQLAQVVDISRCHRRVVLQQQIGIIRFLGAMLRVIDELDVGGNRAPADVFLNLVDDMDATACWHWFKHNITEPWFVGHTVSYVTEDRQQRIVFRLAVRPTKQGSIPYWLHQILRPIRKALYDEEAARIIADHTKVEIECFGADGMSKANNLGRVWSSIEDKALSAGRKVILVIDDEFRKLEDSFYPLMDSYHVVSSFNARDALSKLEATPVDLVIVDLQIGAGGLWKDHETQDFKSTGINICKKIRASFPSAKVGVLTGTHHALPDIASLRLDFFLRKPVDPDTLLSTVKNVLG